MKLEICINYYKQYAHKLPEYSLERECTIFEIYKALNRCTGCTLYSGKGICMGERYYRFKIL